MSHADEPRDLQFLTHRLREIGTAEDEIQATIAELIATPQSATHFCVSCRRSSGSSGTEIEIDGEVAYTSPTEWVYLYRELNTPLGLCDQCFRRGRFEGFTPDEVEYFRERFEETDGPNEVA